MRDQNGREWLHLAGITRLSLASERGPRDGYVFDPHRLALPAWAVALEGRGPALLLTLDRHYDLVVPERPEQVPDRSAGLRAIDEHARWELDVRNVAHIVGAMEAGLITDVIAVARSSPRGAFEGDLYRDTRGREHAFLRAPTVARLVDGYGTRGPSPLAERARELVERAPVVILDVDLDCFTTPSDADPETLVPWPRALAREFLFPEGAESFWSELLPKTVALTLAREPFHCGGLLATDALFAEVAPVLFQELLGAGLP